MLKYLIVLMLICAPARAQVQPASAPVPVESTLLEHQATKGMWFPMSKARELLKTARVAPVKQKILDKTAARLVNAKERNELLTKQIGTAEEISGLWKTTAKQQAEVLAKKESFWRSPYLWVTVGFIVGAGATIGIAVAVQRSGAMQ